VIPECVFQCAKCIEEICSVLKAMPGVSEVSTGKHGETSVIAVQYDPEATSTGDLMEAFGRMPSFYRDSFVPGELNA